MPRALSGLVAASADIGAISSPAKVERERALELSLGGGRAALVRGMSAAGATVTTSTLVQGWGIR